MRDYYEYRSLEVRNKRRTPPVSVKKGDVIVESEPFAHIVDETCRGRYCDHCVVDTRNRALKPCEGCMFVFYCSDACKRESWQLWHRRECKSLARIRVSKGESIGNYARLLARIIFRIQEGGDKFEEKYLNNPGRKYKDLMNHYKDIKNDESRMRDVHNMMATLKEYIGEQNVPNESDFMGIYGRSLVNRFCMSDEFNVPMGCAVYLAASIFDHSCIPNAHPTFIGKKLYIRTLVDWPELNLDKVRISYIDCVNSRQMRQHDLHHDWYFWCDCPLCNDPHKINNRNFMQCDGKDCDNIVEVPERYHLMEIPNEDTPKPPAEKYSLESMKKAIKDAKLEYNYAKIPVNPFTSSDALMSYLYYDKNRYHEAYDPDLTDDDSSDAEVEIDPEDSAETQKQLTNDTSGDDHGEQNNDIINGNLIDGVKDEQNENPKKKSDLKNKANLKQNESNKQYHDTPLTSGNSELTSGNSELTSGNSEHEHLSYTNGVEDHCALTNGFQGNGVSDTKDKEFYKPIVRKLKKKIPKYDPSEVQCSKCKRFVDRNALREYRSATSFTMLRLKNMKETDPNFNVILDVLERQGDIIPKTNVWRVRAMDFAFNAAFGGGAWMLALRYGNENTEGMRLQYGETNPALGLFYMKLAKCHMNLKLYREGLALVALSREILEVAMGIDHPFLTGELTDVEIMANEDPAIYYDRKYAKQREKITEVLCDCCGKKKTVKTYEAVPCENTISPWELDKLVKKRMEEDWTPVEPWLG